MCISLRMLKMGLLGTNLRLFKLENELFVIHNLCRFKNYRLIINLLLKAVIFSLHTVMDLFRDQLNHMDLFQHLVKVVKVEVLIQRINIYQAPQLEILVQQLSQQDQTWLEINQVNQMVITLPTTLHKPDQSITTCPSEPWAMITIQYQHHITSRLTNIILETKAIMSRRWCRRLWWQAWGCLTIVRWAAIQKYTSRFKTSCRLKKA